MDDRFFVVAVKSDPEGEIDEFLVCKLLQSVTKEAIAPQGTPPDPPVAFDFLTEWFNKPRETPLAAEWDFDDGTDVADGPKDGSIAQGGNINPHPR